MLWSSIYLLMFHIIFPVIEISATLRETKFFYEGNNLANLILPKLNLLLITSFILI